MDGILTYDLEEPVKSENSPLLVENCLSEFNEDQKALVRDNLNVYDKDSVYTKEESDISINIIKDFIRDHMNTDDPHGTLVSIDEKLENFVKQDGTTPFLAPQLGVYPTLDSHLTTKAFVKDTLKSHTDAKDPHHIIPEIDNRLVNYVKKSDAYSKSLLYTKDEIDSKSNLYIKKDGTVPFNKAQIGVDPKIDSHLATKRYVDKVVYNHLVDVDPHGFITLLNKRLAVYAKLNNVYDKTLTYSRTLIDSIIRQLVNDAAQSALIDHISLYDPHGILAEIRKEWYIKQDGTIPFTSPQKGVDAIDDNDLVTLNQLNNSVENLLILISDNQPIWKTSGPIESTVGHMDDGTPVPEVMTLQEVLDAIFYGKGISISAPEYVTINTKVPIILCIHGSTGLVAYAELYLNETLIASFTGEDFEDGCISIESSNISENTEFTFVVNYTNDSTHKESITVNVSLPTFVGLLPKWKFGNTITWEYLTDLSLKEPNNNKFIDNSDNLNLISINYDFKDAKLRHPFVVVPTSYPDLNNMSTNSLKFGLEAFDIIDMIPLQVPGINKDIIFKIYIYRLALSSLNLEVTFNFA